MAKVLHIFWQTLRNSSPCHPCQLTCYCSSYSTTTCSLSPSSGSENNRTNDYKTMGSFILWRNILYFYGSLSSFLSVCMSACVCTWPSPTRAETPTDRISSELSVYLAVILPITPPWITWTNHRVVLIRAQKSDMSELNTSAIYHLDDAKKSHQVTILFRLQLEEFQSYDGEHHLENAWEEKKQLSK